MEHPRARVLICYTTYRPPGGEFSSGAQCVCLPAEQLGARAENSVGRRHLAVSDGHVAGAIALGHVSRVPILAIRVSTAWNQQGLVVLPGVEQRGIAIPHLR